MPFIRGAGRIRRRRSRRPAGRPTLLLALALLLGPQAVGIADVASRHDDPFAAVTATGSNLTPFRKWQSVLERYATEEREAAASGCHDARTNSTACLYARWRTFLDPLRNKDRQEQLRAVNEEMNRRPYVTDLDNWRQEDHWSTPGEFFAHSGDCEDFAIAKYLSLRRLGWTGESLRIAAVFDTRLNIGHAIVVVENGGRTWILDNQIPDVVEVASVAHYRPVYSLTETTWRLHQPVEPSAARLEPPDENRDRVGTGSR
jgi:Predicted periplasmic protein